MKIAERKLEMLTPQANNACSGLCQPKSAQVEPNMSQHTRTVTHVHVLIFFISLQVCVHRKSSKQDSLESCCNQKIDSSLTNFWDFSSKTNQFQIQDYIFYASGWWWFPKTICCSTYQSSSHNVVKSYSLIPKPLIACYRSHLELGSIPVTATYTAMEDEQVGV